MPKSSSSTMSVTQSQEELESQALLDNKFTPKLTKAQKELKYFGWISTMLAMFAQALSGAVVTDYYIFRHPSDILTHYVAHASALN